LTDEINSRRSLSVPATILDAWERDAEAMVSEGVLIRDGGLVAFAHQSFFDYCYARSFVAEGRDLIHHIRSGGQDLFHRAQVREILVHLRDADRDRYLLAVQDSLGSVSIRFHIKDAVLTTLEGIEDPGADEWRIVREGITQWDDAVAARLRGIVARFGPWFDLANQESWLRSGLASADPAASDLFVRIASNAQRVRPRQVAALLAPYVGRGGAWPARLAYAVRFADLTSDRALMDVTIAAIRAGDLDALQPFASNGNFWDEAYQLARARPDWAAEFARAYLDRQMSLGTAGDEEATLRGIPEPLDQEFFDVIAKGAPEAFLTEVLPWVLRLAEATARTSRRRFDVFGARWRGAGHRLQDYLLTAIDGAFQRLGETGSSVLDDARSTLVASTTDTANFLLVRLGTASPKHHGPYVVELQTREPIRLEAGYMEDSHWATHDLIEVVSPSVEPALARGLQGAILAYYPAWERGAEGRRSRGHAQWELLSAFPEHTRTPETHSRLLELRHKFGNDEPAPPQQMEVSRIGSPISDDVAPKLSDEQWLAAITRYDSDEIRWDRPPERAGGALQLGGSIFGRTVQEPARFARLAARFPDSVNGHYMNEVLRGLSETTLEVFIDDLMAVCRRAHGLPGRPCGRWIADAIAKRAAERLPDEALAMVSWYATDAADPSSSHGPISGGTMSEAELINSHALNCDRGRALLALGLLVRGDPDRLDVLRSPIEHGSADPIDAVRAAAAEALIGCLKPDATFVARVFRELVATAPDGLLATAPVTRLASYFIQTDFGTWRDLLERMFASADPSIARLAGRFAMLASFSSVDGEPFVGVAILGTAEMRLGVAEVCSANLGNPDVGAACAARLPGLYNDSAPEVRREAATAISTLPREALGDHGELIRTFVASPAFSDEFNLLFHAMAASATLPPELELEACERYLDVFGTSAGDLSTHAATSAAEVSRIAVRAHDHGEVDVRLRALDVIDRLLAVSAYAINEAIAAYER
jgi:hypothetical protein